MLDSQSHYETDSTHCGAQPVDLTASVRSTASGGEKRCSYSALHAAAGQLDALGLQLITVIPIELDAERWPVNKAGEIVRGKDGKPSPAFTGKNPSHWGSNGEPSLLSHRKPMALAELDAAVDRARSLGMPIGIAVIPSTVTTVVDLDRKDFDSTEAMEAAYQRMLKAWPDLAKTRTERTPGGGLHIYIKVADGMASWRKPRGTGHLCRFTTDDSGAHHGEILYGTRVCVAAPTENSRGPYALLSQEHAYNIIEVPDLAAIGIKPTTVVKAEKAAATRAAKAATNTVKPGPYAKPKQEEGTEEPPQLEALLGKFSKHVLSGGRPFGEDRSSNLAGLAKEAYGWENWLNDEGLTVTGSADAVVAVGVAALEIEDKVDRVLEGIDRAACILTITDEKARKRYGFHAGGGRSSDQHIDGFEGQSDGGDQDPAADERNKQEPEAQPEPKTTKQEKRKGPLTIAEVRQRLKAGVEAGSSKADLQELVIALASASDLNAAGIRALLQTIEQEDANANAIAQEAATLRAEVDRRDLGSVLTLEFLLPHSVAEAMRIRCLALPTDPVSAVMTYLAAVSGVVKLGTAVVGNQAAEFIVPMNLFTALVGKSGAKKSPLGKLLVKSPTMELKRDLARDHARAMRAWEEENRGLPSKDRTEPPQAARLEVNNFTTEALAEQLQIQEQRGLGLLIHRDELAGVFGSMNKYGSGKGDDEEQLLEAWDGTGFSSLRIATKGGGRFYDRCHLSIFGTIQPAVLEELVGNGDDSGLWARFMFMPLPEKVVPLPSYNSKEEEAAAIAAATEAARILADACGAIYRRRPSQLHLSAEARTAFNRYEARCQGDALRSHLSAQSALYGKSAGKVLRVAGLLHLLQEVAVDGEADEEITAATMEKATSLVDHLNGWALSLHAEIANGGPSPVMRIVHKLAMGAAGPIRWKDVQNRLTKGQRKEIDSAAVTAAMEALAGLEVGEVEYGARGAAAYRALRPLP